MVVDPTTVAWALAITLLLALVWLFNRIVRARTHVQRAWAQVDTQLQRRHDLIPAMVATVDGARVHERDLLDLVTAARRQATAVSDPTARAALEDQLTEALGPLIALDERYPILRSDGVFQGLATQLRDAEDRIAFARGFANDRVARYRTIIDTMPGLLLARVLRCPREGLFALDSDAPRTPPDLSSAITPDPQR